MECDINFCGEVWYSPHVVGGGGSYKVSTLMEKGCHFLSQFCTWNSTRHKGHDWSFRLFVFFLGLDVVKFGRTRRQKRQTNSWDHMADIVTLLKKKAQIPCVHRPYSPMRHLCIGSPSFLARDNLLLRLCFCDNENILQLWFPTNKSPRKLWNPTYT